MIPGFSDLLASDFEPALKRLVVGPRWKQGNRKDAGQGDR